MEYIAIAVLLVFLTFALQFFSFRRKSINCSIDALKKTINTLPVESTPSGRVMKSKLAKQYYFISHRVKSNDIRDYAKRIFGIKSPQPEHIAMLLLMGLHNEFLQEHQTTNFQPYEDLAKWCNTAYEYLIETERNKHLDT
ncbi:TPA: hypothetical protein NJ542_004547 [Vibrio parahaemolyticus]|nr:hypothetical protein [Vibrio parahaemolyticus]